MVCKTPKNNNMYNYHIMMTREDYIILFSATMVIILSIFTYGWVRCNIPYFSGYDVFGTRFSRWVDGWVILHFIVFMVAGMIFPDALILSMTIGILWEVFEYLCGTYKPKLIESYGACRNNIRTANKSDLKATNGKFWWYGQWEDVAADLTGFLVGKFLLNGYYEKSAFKNSVEFLKRCIAV